MTPIQIPISVGCIVHHLCMQIFFQILDTFVFINPQTQDFQYNLLYKIPCTTLVSPTTPSSWTKFPASTWLSEFNQWDLVKVTLTSPYFPQKNGCNLYSKRTSSHKIFPKDQPLSPRRVASCDIMEVQGGASWPWNMLISWAKRLV